MRPSPFVQSTVNAPQAYAPGGSICMLTIASLVGCNTLMLIVDLDGIGVIDLLSTLAYISEWHTVMVPVFAQVDMIVLLNFSLNGMP